MTHEQRAESIIKGRYIAASEDQDAIVQGIVDALTEVDRQVRLEEAKLWDKHGHVSGTGRPGWGVERLSILDQTATWVSKEGGE
jgi:hypothetical protein